jgi:outer membrane protein TolC
MHGHIRVEAYARAEAEAAREALARVTGQPLSEPDGNAGPVEASAIRQHPPGSLSGPVTGQEAKV